MELVDRVALVTGGAIRLGRTIALTLAQHGADVVITYRTSKQAARETVERLRELGSRAEAVKVDVTQAKDISALIARIRRQFGRLDVLVNNASIFERTPFDTLKEADWDAHMDANLKGPFLCALAASKLMKRKGGGKIINIADWAGERPYKDYLPYCVSKAGLLALTKSLAKELAPSIQTIAIAPGPILPPPNMTPASRWRAVQRLPLKRWGSPQDIANAVMFALEATDFITGTAIYVDGGRLIA